MRQRPLAGVAPRVRSLLLVSPVYAGAARGLNAAQRDAFARMDDTGQRVLAEGIEAIDPLFAPLPSPIRAVAQAMARRFDPASVAATTRFLASGVQPFTDLAELAAVRVPTLVVPGTDPEHPPEIAEGYASTIPTAVLADPDTDLVGTVTTFLRAHADA